jgi:hypothetical protein
VLTRGIVAYRTGSFTLAQVWENGEGKAIGVELKTSYYRQAERNLMSIDEHVEQELNM